MTTVADELDLITKTLSPNGDRSTMELAFTMTRAAVLLLEQQTSDPVTLNHILQTLIEVIEKAKK